MASGRAPDRAIAPIGRLMSKVGAQSLHDPFATIPAARRTVHPRIAAREDCRREAPADSDVAALERTRRASGERAVERSARCGGGAGFVEDGLKSCARHRPIFAEAGDYPITRQATFPECSRQSFEGKTSASGSGRCAPDDRVADDTRPHCDNNIEAIPKNRSTRTEPRVASPRYQGGHPPDMGHPMNSQDAVGISPGS